ncbi:hypothetical protein SEA_FRODOSWAGGINS_32 [Streptomyces phage FrodoSwaggins]|uniref:Uncharacterized protein n=4 Tax=Rimavirus drgrey TaxID=2560783 RepID=A0A649VXB1_9CAUD|nr:hypothetical protein FDI43_gp32 [Streptomyces phage DrGrey]ASU03945.1 hypothetical protein SEA_DRGREY_32 [Streptomyces phage DrGrey]QAY17066.1 hypothetical protein SEA_POPY_32 [Streptomyces phage Popy]QEQ94645.1 hypothetical protein SEA_SOSHI_32 [Streptomyces phage Soshi]QGJ96572.1 hypothetical protein SEA_FRODOSWAGGINS_32 [Streptomyces phage FrodoSwaggins]
MNIKQKFEKAKKKYQENQIAVDATIIAGCLATAAFCLHVIKRIDEIREDIAEAREDVEMADAKIRLINDSAKHVRETGHSVTIFNGRDEPMFIMNPVPDEN